MLLYPFIHRRNFGARTLAKVAQYENVLVPENWQRVQRPWCRTCKQTRRAFINKYQSPVWRLDELQIGEQIRHAPDASEIDLQPSSRSLTAQVMNPCREHQFAEGWFGPCTVHTLEPLHKHQAGHSSLDARRSLKVSPSPSTQISFRQSAQSEVQASCLGRRLAHRSGRIKHANVLRRRRRGLACSAITSKNLRAIGGHLEAPAASESHRAAATGCTLPIFMSRRPVFCGS